MTPADHRILAELFGANHLRQLAYHGWSETLGAAADLLRLSPDSRGGDVFDTAFEVLRREYPIEYLYKSCVLQKWVFGTYSPRTSALYMEFRVANARADMLFVNGRAEVLEVKTRFDDTTRLEPQLEEYYRCFKSVSLVVEEHQVAQYAEQLPEQVGLLALTPRYQLSVRRRPRESSENLDTIQISRLLHQRELREAVVPLGVDTSGFHPIDRLGVEWGLFLSQGPSTAYDCLVQALQDRQRTDKMAARCRQLPSSLHPSVFMHRLRKMDWDRLEALCAKPINLLEQGYRSSNAWSDEW